MKLGPGLRLGLGLGLGLILGCDSGKPPPAVPEAPRTTTSASAAAGGVPASPMLLADVTREAGLAFVHDPMARGDCLFPEITGSGCGFVDYDNDGWLDIYFVQSGRDLKHPDVPAKPNILYRNRGDGTFEDVTARSGAGDTGYGQGMAAGDYNNDGYTDIYVENLGPDVLLRNNGDGTFTDVTSRAGVGNPGWGIGCGFLDIDNDGWLDLFVANYVEWSVATDVACIATNTGRRDYCGPESYAPGPDALYRNNGDGAFTDVSARAGLQTASGPGMSALCADFDDDGRTDIFVASDTSPNQLWMNRGEGRFEDQAMLRGCAVGGMGQEKGNMGCNAEDVDGDGDLDLFMCAYISQTSTLYLNQGRIFQDITIPTGLGALTVNRTSFGACVLDLFNDGTLCVYVGNGGVCVPHGRPPDPRNPRAQRDMVLQWSWADRRFTDVSDRVGPAMDYLGVSRGVAVGDYDNDGDVDVLVSHNNGPGRLLRNDAGNGQHWFMVRCAGTHGARDAIGAKVLLTAGGRTRRRDVVVNYSYACASDPRVHFGLGALTRVDRLTVKWPGGREATWEDLPADQVFEARPPP